MMLVLKPTSALPQHPAQPSHHRRHPSAPPQVVVQPTRVPGLLSIAKINKASLPHRQLPANQRKGQAPPQKKQVARAPALLNPAEITEKRPAQAVLQGPVSPTPVRGRVAPKQGKERRNKQHGRQPSPPVVEDTTSSSPPSQAEVSVPSHNQFDPFVAKESTTPKANPKSTPVSVPVVSRPHLPRQQHLSTSAPTRSNVRPRAKKAHSSVDRFPVCDDMTDAGDQSEAETPPPHTPPATPLRRQAFPKGQANSGFPFNYPSPQQKKGGRQHRRSPSEGVFNMSMSSDEDVSAASENINLNSLLTFARSRAQGKPPATPSPSFSRATAVTFVGGHEKVPAPFFASSLFQNSPSPDDLPNLDEWTEEAFF